MCTTLKINNKHETTAHLLFFPICEYSVLVFPTGFDFFHSLPALLPYHAMGLHGKAKEQAMMVAAGMQTINTSILAYANRNRILTKLVASFPLLFTTSSNVVCSKFSGV